MRCLGSEPLISLSSFLLFWGVSFVVVTSVIAVVVREHERPPNRDAPTTKAEAKAEAEGKAQTQGILNTYYKVWRLVTQLPRTYRPALPCALPCDLRALRCALFCAL